MSEAAYKYMSAYYALKTLRDLELKITPPNQFNDPFEFSPRVICSSPEREAKRILKLKAEIKGMYEEEKQLGIFRGNFREYRERMRRMRPTLISGVAGKMHEANAHLQHNYLDGISRDVGVLSLSARPNSIVMWGHYGDKHRGMVIGFDTAWEVFRSGKGLRSVRYDRKRLTWDSACKPGSAAEKAYVVQMICHKNDEWAYEDELRQMFKLAGLKRRPLEDRGVGYFLSVPAHTVVSVLLGARCSIEDEAELRSVLDNRRFSHVTRPKRARLHDTEFALEF
ncbi:MAG TPA: DUF2971 domain-containing protein [Chthoniobacterales bacterium]